MPIARILEIPQVNRLAPDSILQEKERAKVGLIVVGIEAFSSFKETYH